MNAADALMAAYLDGGLSAGQVDELERWLRADRRHSRAFVRYTMLHCQLGEELRHQNLNTFAADAALDDQHFSATLALLEDKDAEALVPVDITDVLHQRELQQQEAARRREDRLTRLGGILRAGKAGPHMRHYVIPTPVFYGGIAALIALVAMLLMSNVPPQVVAPPAPPVAVESDPAPRQPALVQVATLVEQVDAQWEGASHAMQPGARVLNEPLKLTSGFAKLRFDKGAEVVLQAPASIEPLSARELRITEGKLVGLCETQASKGFTVFAPNAKIVDLGTEFGVAVDESGQTLAQVFEGAIELAGTSNGKAATGLEKLVAGQATAIDPTGTQLRSLDAQPLAFVNSEEFTAKAREEDSAYYRWLAYSYELRRDPALVAYYVFDEKDAAAKRLVNRSVQGEALDSEAVSQAHGAPFWMSGRWNEKSALMFQGEQESAVRIVSTPALDVGEPLTLAAWVCPEGDPGGGHILSRRGDDAYRDYHFQMAYFGPHPPSGESQLPGQVIQFAGGDNPTSYSPPLRFRSHVWQLIVVTIDGDGVIRHFLDGALVFSDKLSRKIAPVDADLMIGTDTLQDDPYAFRGRIDELAIYKRALSAREVARMYEYGMPP